MGRAKNEVTASDRGDIGCYVCPMGWLARLRKNFAIRSYLQRLGPLLVRRYGVADSYSPGRVLATIARHHLSQRHAEYACAMFTTRERFAQWMEERHLADEQPVIIKEIAYPYRSRLHPAPAVDPIPVDWRGIFDALRAEVAEQYANGSQRFVPREEHHFEQYSNGDNASAAARWGPGL